MMGNDKEKIYRPHTATALFCDDIREEIGNKRTYVGVYGPWLEVDQFPTDKITMNAVVELQVPQSELPKDAEIHVVRHPERLTDALKEFSLQELEHIIPAEHLRIPKGVDNSKVTHMTLASVIELDDLDEECWITVLVDWGDGIQALPGLRISSPEKDSAE